MKIAVSGQALGMTMNLENILQILAGLSVKWIELWPKNLADGTKQTKDILEKYDITPACLTIWSKELAKGDAMDGYCNDLKKLIDTAQEIGAKMINCYFKPFAGENSLKYFAEKFYPIVCYAKTKDIIVLMENEAHDFSGSALNMLNIIECINMDNFKITYDPCNFYHANEEAFPYCYEILKKHIGYVHLKGGCVFMPGIHDEVKKGKEFAGPHGDRFIYYSTMRTCAINYFGLIEKLVKDGYSGFYTIEPHVKKEDIMNYYEQDIGYLRRMDFT